MSPIIHFLPILVLFFFLDSSIHIFAGNFPTPRSPIDSFTNYEHGHSGIHLVTQDSTHSTPKLRKLAFGRVNTIATGVTIVFTILNIIVYKLRQIHEASLRKKYTRSEQLCRRFLLVDILLATKNFDDSLVIGKGGFGKVYKGVIDDGAITVAVKRLNSMSKQGYPEFWAEIGMLSRTRHTNIVSLIGYCDDCDEMILVYEFMIHGALTNCMHRDGNKSALTWNQRVKICIGAARGLDYLHTGTGGIIHRDMKSSNILLDENWTAKISDFGLSKIVPANQLHTHVSTDFESSKIVPENQFYTYASTNVKGTFGYLDPEYLLTRRVSRKSDVYAFGVVLFEVLCGRRAVDLRLDEEQRGLAGWAQHCVKEGKLDQIVDPSLRGQILSHSLKAFAQIADQCLNKFSTKRPTMAEVVVALELSLTLQEREFSIVGEELFNTGGDCNNQENADSSIKEQVVISATNDLHHVEQIKGIFMQLDGASNEESRVTPAKIMLSWSKALVKWFNVKSKKKDYKTDEAVYEEGGDVERRNSFSEREPCTHEKSKTEKSTRNAERARRRRANLDRPQVINVENYSIFAATWNVGGKSPSINLNLDDWLHAAPPADIYVLGFQEIVPLNAGNILGAEDNGPAKKWLALVRKTLNNLSGTSGGSDYSSGHRGSDYSSGHRASDYSSGYRPSDYSLGHRASDYSSSYRPSDYSRWGSSDDDYGPGDSPSTVLFSPMEQGHRTTGLRYFLAAGKQMVGIFLMIWVKSDLWEHVRNMKVSCVGRGLMGYLRNRGSISVSILLHQTSFCFVCSHLSSGQKEGDELRRNSDVMEILRKTRFPRVNGVSYDKSPETILEHDRVIWLGDLNYRIALPSPSVKALVEMQNWRVLLENDQLRIEQRRGRVFEGWKEGKIYFPPTYKYSNNSDRYTGEDMHPKEKQITPAWCDRILWYGGGLQQLSYVRGESRFSSHRPVYSIFWAEVE